MFTELLLLGDSVRCRNTVRRLHPILCIQRRKTQVLLYQEKIKKRGGAKAPPSYKYEAKDAFYQDHYDNSQKRNNYGGQ